MNESSTTGKKQIGAQRLINLSDGIFAIAVTLLAFNLKVPEIAQADVHRLLGIEIKAMMPHFFTYVITFLLLAVFWTIHHRILDLVTHIDSTFIWINIAYLLIISFIPFPSALIGNYPYEELSIVLYLCCGIAVGILNICMLGYASYNGRLTGDNAPKELIRYYFTRAMISVSVMLLVLLLAVMKVHGAQYFLSLLIPVNWTLRSLYRHPLKRKQEG